MQFQAAFEQSYDCKLGTDLNGKVKYYPDATKGQDGPLVLVEPFGGDAWTGMFGFGRLGVGITGVFATPNPDVICVVAKGEGYWVSTSDPDAWQPVRCAPILDVRPAPLSDLLLFVNFTEVTAYGRSGMLWKSERLSLDGLKIDEVRPSQLIGRHYSHSLDTEETFTIDLPSGRLTRPINL